MAKEKLFFSWLGPATSFNCAFLLCHIMVYIRTYDANIEYRAIS